MTFAETLMKLATAIAKDPLPAENKFLTPRLVHRVGWTIGVPTQNNPAFDDFARRITGTTDLRQMTQWQLHALVRAMPELKGAFTQVMLP